MPLIEDSSACNNDPVYSLICKPQNAAEQVMRDKCFHKDFIQDFKEGVLVGDMKDDDICEMPRLEPFKVFRPGSKYADPKFQPYKDLLRGKRKVPQLALKETDQLVLEAKIRRRDRLMEALEYETDPVVRQELEGKIERADLGIKYFRREIPAHLLQPPVERVFEEERKRFPSPVSPSMPINEGTRQAVLGAFMRKRDRLLTQLATIAVDDIVSRQDIERQLSSLDQRMRTYQAYPTRANVQAEAHVPAYVEVVAPIAKLNAQASTSTSKTKIAPSTTHGKLHVTPTAVAKPMEKVVKLNRTAQLRLAQATLRKVFAERRRGGGGKRKTRKQRRRRHGRH